MSEEPVTRCRECGAPVERVFHPVAVHFKGSGFYTTDYARGHKDGKDAGAGESKKKDTEKTKSSSEGGSKDAGGEKTKGAKAGSSE